MKIGIDDAKRIVNKVTHGGGGGEGITRLLKSSSQRFCRSSSWTESPR